jgi:formate C-acetyltransferase
MAIDAEVMNNAWKNREKVGLQPLASCFINDCLEKGVDFDRGGARYNWVENAHVGLANLVDGLIAIKNLVYGSKEISLAEFNNILKSDFEGQEELRERIINNIPSYGTDNDEADSLAVECAHFLQETTESHVVGLHRGVPGFFCWIIHSYFGEVTGATPDGRKAFTAFADGAGAAQGRETCGPTASILSTTKWSHKKVLGGLVQNIKFSESAIATESGRKVLLSLIETYLRRGGFEIQVNVVGAATLRDAQLHPENYPDLIVRVAGYSDYFTHLNPVMQAEVIARTEHMQ